MQLLNAFQVAILAASQVSAVPITGADSIASNPMNELTKRANPAPVSCGPANSQRAWPLESVQDAFQGLQDNGNLPNNQKPLANERYYPRQVGQGSKPPSDPGLRTALDAIPECATSKAGSYKWYEFPITDPKFAGCKGSACQGPDRVIAISPNIGPGGTRTFTYCLAVTHRGETTPGDFEVCTNAP